MVVESACLEISVLLSRGVHVGVDDAHVDGCWLLRMIVSRGYSGGT